MEEEFQEENPLDDFLQTIVDAKKKEAEIVKKEGKRQSRFSFSSRKNDKDKDKEKENKLKEAEERDSLFQSRRAGGRLLHKGYLIKQGNSQKNWRKRWFILVQPKEFHRIASPKHFNEPLTKKNSVRVNSKPSPINTDQSHTKSLNKKSSSKSLNHEPIDENSELEAHTNEDQEIDEEDQPPPACLCYYYAKGGSSHARPLNVIILNEGIVVQTHPDRFEIDTDSRTFFLRANSPEECTEWVNKIAKVLPTPLESEHQIPELPTSEVDPKKTTDSSSPVSEQKPVVKKQSPFDLSLKAFSTSSIKEGYLIKEGNRIKNKKKRFFVLRGQVLIYYKDQTKREPLGIIYLYLCQGLVRCETQAKIGFQFDLTTYGRIYPLLAESEEERDDWIDKISKVVNTLTLRRAIDADTDSLMFNEDSDDDQNYTSWENETFAYENSDHSDHEEDIPEGEEDIFDADPFGENSNVVFVSTDSSLEAKENIPSNSNSNSTSIPKEETKVIENPTLDIETQTQTQIQIEPETQTETKIDSLLSPPIFDSLLSNEANEFINSPKNAQYPKFGSRRLSKNQTKALMDDLFSTLGDLDDLLSNEVEEFNKSKADAQNKKNNNQEIPPLINTDDNVDAILNALANLQDTV